MLYILKAFETGADGLALVTCPQNECRHLEGNLRAVKRAEQVNILLEETGMGGNRVEVFAANGNGIEDIVKKIKEFRERIRNLP
jgi:coenzyme F420-reducing hydrogenase delta subunit